MENYQFIDLVFLLIAGCIEGATGYERDPREPKEKKVKDQLVVWVIITSQDSKT